MKKYQVIWGWEPPQYDNPNNNFRLFYGKQQKTEIREHIDHETGEVSQEEVTYWLCDVVEYEYNDDPKIFNVVNKSSLSYQKYILSKQIELYDNSNFVNEFYIGNTAIWLNKADRVGLQLRLEYELSIGKESTILWHNGVSFPLPLIGDYTAFDMLIDIEVYASKCYDNTQKHLAEIMKIANVEEIMNYDYTTGYPEKLKFG